VSQQITFQKISIKQGTKRLKANWSVDIEQDLKLMYNVDITQNVDMNPEGVKVYPYDPNNENRFKRTEWKYKVVGTVQKNGKIKIDKDITKKTKRERVISRKRFESRYFTDAL